jgi:hypothetical protein
MPNNALLVNKYEWPVIAAFNFCVIVFVPLAIWLAVYTFFFYTAGDVVKARIYCTACLLFSPMFVWGRIGMGDIRVDDDGIGLWAWGRRWKYTRWVDVKNLTLDTVPAHAGNRSPQTAYFLYIAGKKSDGNSRKCGISFDDTRPHVEALIDAVNHYIRLHNIETIDKRTQVITPTA